MRISSRLPRLQFSLLLSVLTTTLLAGCSTIHVFGAPEPVFSSSRVALNSGHTDAVTSILRDTRTGYVFTASRDGTVKIWAPDSHSLLRTMRISPFQLVDLAVSPDRPEIAVVATDGALYFELSGWNWETGRKLFGKSLSEAPLTMQFSPQGSFLSYSLAEWKSMQFLDSSNGNSLNYLPNAFGIVRFQIISPTERTLMTYTPSTGSLVYWDIGTGTQKAAPIMTLSGLSELTALSDLYAVGVSGTQLTVINILSGATAAQRDLGMIDDISVNTASGQIYVVYRPASVASASGTGGQTTGSNGPGSNQSGGANDGSTANPDRVALFSFQNGSLQELYFAGDRAISAEAAGTPTALLGLDGSILFGRPDGSLAMLYQYSGTVAPFARNRIRPIDDIAFTRDNLFVVTDADLLNINSDLFSLTGPDLSRVSFVRENITRNPFQASSGLATTLYGQLFLWRHDEQPGSMYLVDPRTLEVSDFFDRFDAPLVALKPAANNLLTLDRSGKIQLINSYTYDTSFTLTSQGTQTVADARDFGILLGRNTSNLLDSSLIRVSAVTGETVSLKSSDFLVFRLLYDQQNNRVFSVGMSEDANGSVSTVVESHAGVNFSQVTPITTSTSEDLGGDIAYDTDANILYSSVGYGSVSVWDGVNRASLQSTQHVARKLFVNNGKVYSINRDGSLSVWDASSKEHLFDFYLLDNSSWLAVTPQGRYFGSSYGNPEQYLSLIRFDPSTGRYSPSTPGASSLSDFRLKLAPAGR